MSISRIMKSIEGQNNAGTDPLALLRRLTDASPTDVLNVRLIIEPQAATTAVSNANGAEIKAIRDAHEAAVAQDDLDGFEHWDAVFHRRIFAATRNELLITLQDILSGIREKQAWLGIKKAVVSDDIRAKYCKEHAAITDAIAGRNAQRAHDLMRAHLISVSRDMFPE